MKTPDDLRMEIDVARVKRKWSRADLARKMRRHDSVLSRWFSGQRGKKHGDVTQDRVYQRACRAMGIKP